MKKIFFVMILLSVFTLNLQASEEVSNDANTTVYKPLTTGWHMLDAPQPMTLEASRALLDSKLEIENSKISTKSSVLLSKTVDIIGASGKYIHPDVAEMAQNLLNDPLKIYDFVYNRIKYEPYFGFKKGSYTTMLSEAGNDFDQAALLYDLLVVAGYDVELLHGYQTISAIRLANLLGISNTSLVSSILSYTGIHREYIDGDWKIEKLWVEVEIDGEKIQLDPSMKEHKINSALEITDSMIGYNRDDFITALGGEITENYVKDINYTVMKEKLTQYSATLHNYFQDNLSDKSTKEILGEAEIIQKVSTNLVSQPYPYEVISYWNTIPLTYTSTMKITCDTIDHTFSMAELDINRITISFDANNAPLLKFNGALIAQGTNKSLGTHLPLSVAIDHPTAYNDGTYSDQTSSSILRTNASFMYAIPYGSGYQRVSKNIVKEITKKIDNYKNAGYTEQSEEVLGETLHYIGNKFINMHYPSKSIPMRQHGFSIISDHNFGIVQQEESLTINWIGSSSSIIPIKWTTDDKYNSYFTSVALGSALESGIIDQLYDIVGLSTVKMLYLTNSRGEKIHFLHNDYFPEALLLSTYTQSNIDDFKQNILDGGWTLLPENGEITVNNWTGHAWTQVSGDANRTSIAYKIGKAYGGHTSEDVKATDADLDNNEFFSWLKIFDIDYDTFSSCAGDPIDLSSGYYFDSHTDIGIYSKIPISFTRTYNSGVSSMKHTLGYGWNHSQNISISKSNLAYPLFGERTIYDTIPMFVFSHVGVDLFSDLVGCPKGQIVDKECLYKQDAQGHIYIHLMAQWLIDLALDNTIVVTIGSKKINFVKQPNGEFISSSNTQYKLSLSNGNYIVETVSGIKYTFSDDNLLQSIENLQGDKNTYTYNSDKTLQQIRDKFNRGLDFFYSDEKLREVTNTFGHSVEYLYDSNNDLTSVKDKNSQVWEYLYDDKHRLISSINPEMQTSQLSLYNDKNQVISQELYIDNFTATSNYLASGYITTLLQNDGTQKSYFYDNLGREYAKKDENKHTFLKKYDAKGNVASRVMPNQSTMNYQYDTNNNLVKTTNSYGESLVQTYDLKNRLVKTQNPLNHQEDIVYDTHNNITSFTNKDRYVQNNTYDAQGNLIQATDYNGVEVKYEYDAYNYLKKKTILGAEYNTTVNYVYDAAGQLVSLTDQINNSTFFEYDNNGNVIKITDPNGKITHYIYDKANRLSETIDRNNLSVRYSYDALDNLLSIISSEDTTTYTYTSKQKVKTIQNSAGTIQYEYDLTGKIIKSTDVNMFVLDYTYDSNGNITSIKYPNGKSVFYTYDLNNQITHVKSWLGKDALYQYDLLGRPVNKTHFNGAQTHYAYNKENKKVQITHLNSSNEDFALMDIARDAIGNAITVDSTLPLRRVDQNRDQNFTYSPNGTRLISDGTDAMLYDDEGNMIQFGQKTFLYNSLNKLVEYNNTNEVEKYTYDGIGNRVIKEKTEKEFYVYDIFGNLVAIANENKMIEKYFIYAGRLLIGMIYNNEIYTYHYDHNANVVAITDPQGKVSHAYRYDPFGEVNSKVEAFTQPFSFVGKYGVQTDSETMYYMRNRYYLSSLRRFISQDPLGFAGGDVNLYTYVANNPMNYIDPDGREGFIVDVGGWVVFTSARVVAGVSGSKTKDVISDWSTPAPQATPIPQNIPNNPISLSHEAVTNNVMGNNDRGFGAAALGNELQQTPVCGE